MSDPRTAELEAQIAAQRDQLAETVDQLTHKLDVKAQAKERSAQVVDRATTADGKPRPELLREDGLHLSPAGYALWTARLQPVLARYGFSGVASTRREER